VRPEAAKSRVLAYVGLTRQFKNMKPEKLPFTATILFAWSLIACVLIIGNGCISTASTPENIIIRAEQAESGTLAAFNFVVNSDDVNRSFWQTNAPAFHQFAEWLRTPITNNGVVTRRGLYMIKQVNDAKVLYRSNPTQSNILWTAISALELAQNQAKGWQLIATSPTH